ncbi:MAG: hypothetical protein ACYCSW_03750 [bacterium]
MIKIKSILVIITLIFIFTVNNVYANSITVNYKYVGFSGTKIITVGKLANTLINDINYRFAKRFSDKKYGFGIYLNPMRSSGYYTVNIIVNIYKYKNSILDAGKAFTVAGYYKYYLNNNSSKTKIKDIKKSVKLLTKLLIKTKQF